MTDNRTKARSESSKKFHDKTYSTYLLRLRVVEDADIIADIERAKSNGVPIRVWLSSLFNKK